VLEIEQEIGIDRCDAAHWLISYLGKEFADEHIKASQAIGMPIHNTGPMDAEKTAAIFHEVNLGKKGRDFLRKYLLAHQGFTGLASEKKVLDEKYLAPHVRQFQYHHNIHLYWLNYVHKAVQHFMELHYSNSMVDCNQPPAYEHMEILWGGDHG
jgi:hypothetical protein